MQKFLKSKMGMVAIAAILLIPLIYLVMAEFVKSKNSPGIGSDKTRGIRNNNPLNLRRTGTPWKGEKTLVTDKEFEEFDSMMWGLRAGLRNMRTKMTQGYNTLGSLITVWSPPTENNTENYISLVASATGLQSGDTLEFEKDFMFPVVREMVRIESGLILTPELYEEAWTNI